MPNHITNIVTARGPLDELMVYQDFMATQVEDGTIYFDFNKLIPRSEDLNIESSSRVDDWFYLIDWTIPSFLTKEKMDDRIARLSDEEKDSAIDLAKKYLSNIEKYWYSNWYDWSIVYWGTKWNGYSSYRKKYLYEWDDSLIVFDSAWSTPTPVWEALAKRFPNLSFDIKFADEDIGSNCWMIFIEKGNVLETTDESWNDDFAREVVDQNKWSRFGRWDI